MTDEALSPLRRRLIEDMTIRKFVPKTQHDYVQRVKELRGCRESTRWATIAEVEGARFK